MDSSSDHDVPVKPVNHQLAACLLMTQSVSELNLFLAADSVVAKNFNLSDMWRLDIIGDGDPVQMNDNEKALKQFNDMIYCDGE